MSEATHDSVRGEPEATAEPHAAAELLSRVELIEAQPLAQRSAGFDQVAEELLAELQRSDHEGA